MEKGQTDQKGTYAFRGFYGDYKLVVTGQDGNRHTFTIDLNSQEANQWTFRLR